MPAAVGSDDFPELIIDAEHNDSAKLHWEQLTSILLTNNIVRIRQRTCLASSLETRLIGGSPHRKSIEVFDIISRQRYVHRFGAPGENGAKLA